MPLKGLYLLINLFTISFPLIRSFEHRINYFSKWKYVFIAEGIVMLLFIPWDIAFTNSGIWGFNPKYLSGVYLFNLPIEEWLFFVTVPFSCIFIYESLKLLVKFYPGPRATKIISLFLIGFLLLALGLNTDKAYTSLTFLLVVVFILLGQFVFRLPFMGRIYWAYLFVLLPFLIVNGVLTGFGIPEQVVWYNSEEFMGFRIGTIPFEDTFYGFLLIALNIAIYLKLQGRVS